MMNDTEITVMGGMGVDEEGRSEECLGDLYIFNTHNSTFERQIQDFAGLLQFQAEGNKVVQLEDNTIIALVENGYQNEDTFVVEYKKGTKVVKQLQKIV